MRVDRTAIAAALSLLLATSASGQPAPTTGSAQSPQPNQSPQTKDSGQGKESVTKKAEDIAKQPARDVGLSKDEIPPVLVSASEAPYSLQDIKTCKQLVAAIEELNTVLGPDFSGEDKPDESKTQRLAEAGGKAVVNSLIPFRGLVREVSGAASAQRARTAAIDAGFARRGFLRGVHRKQGCKQTF